MNVHVSNNRLTFFGLLFLACMYAVQANAGKLKCRTLVSLVVEGYEHLKTGNLVHLAVRNPYGNDPASVAKYTGAFKGITTAHGGEDIELESGRLIPLDAVEGDIDVVNRGEAIEVSVRDPYANNPSQVVKFIEIFKGITTAYGEEDIEFESGKLISTSAVEGIRLVHKK